MILHALGWALVHGLWQAALVAGLVRVALFVARTPRVRFALAWSGLLVIAVAFVITLRLELGRAAMVDDVDAIASARGLLGAIELALPWLVALWAIGVVVFGLRAALGFVGVARLRAQARPVEAEITALAQALAAKLSLARAVAIAECEALDVPAVIGWLRPLILLPIGFAAGLDRATLEAAIAHELAHVRRRDYLLNAIALAIEALFFHHPCVWWLAGVARREREHACDDLVVAHVQSRGRYARSLLVIEQLRAGFPSPSASLAVDGASLLERVRRLQNHSPSRSPATEGPSRSMTTPLSRHFRFLPLIALATAVALAAALPACIEQASDEEEQLRELPLSGAIEGKIVIGDPDETLDIPWLPESVARHAERIEATARRTGVDPDLLAIIVLLESNGDPAAESPTGARGLMQLMPQTASMVLAQDRLHRKVKQVTQLHGNVITDPDLNLHIGATYLGWQLDQWGDVELAAAAYNGGPRAVEGWLAGESELSEETDRYRTRVAQLWQARHAEAPPPR